MKSRILLLANYPISDLHWGWLTNCPNNCSDEVEFVVRAKGKVDLLVVFNSVRRPQVVTVPKNKTLKVVQEPRVAKSIFHTFVTRHSAFYGKVWGHAGSFGGKSTTSHIVRAPIAFPQVSAGYLPAGKTKLVSIVSSTLSTLPGHRARNQFIDRVIEFNPAMTEHTYGRGRLPIEKKEEALDSYMYSLAIENDSTPGYVTEKFIDCILRETVPIYFGATDISSYFPKESYIMLTDLESDSAEILLDGLSASDYQRRLPILRHARHRYLNEQSLCCQIVNELSSTKPGRNRTIILLPPFGELLKWSAQLVKSYLDK